MWLVSVAGCVTTAFGYLLSGTEMHAFSDVTDIGHNVRHIEHRGSSRKTLTSMWYRIRPVLGV